MCGIAGFYSFHKIDHDYYASSLEKAIRSLQRRGPDSHGFFSDNQVGLAHSRLSIIDTSADANQPFTSSDGRYTIIFNGEIFNYQELYAEKLKDLNVQLHTTSDTEVLLQLYIYHGKACLEWLSGFFALAIYDKQDGSLFMARDRFGKKPLHIYHDNEKIVFASELKALIAFGIKKELDTTSLYQYLQLNYIPQPFSILKNVSKLEAGSWLLLQGDNINKGTYYKLTDTSATATTPSYADAQHQLYQLLESATKKRLISDVPLGAFLSGGIDSSVVVGLASQFKKGIHTFSIGYKDEPFYDETHYAELVANKFQTHHTTFKLSNDDLLEHVSDILDYIDEPFADSSAIAVYILSQRTRKHVTVALSGDGADEIFAGYHKYMAEYKMRQGGLKNEAVKLLGPLWKALPKSRGSKWMNTIRQLDRFAEGAALSAAERHWLWSSLMNEEEAKQLSKLPFDAADYQHRKKEILQYLKTAGTLNDNLLTDVHLVLQGDMLVKVDLMSMANSLEVRSPFLDHEVVDFAFSLPASYKIDGTMKKKIVQDAFRGLLPPELYNRPKRGFEVPILKWFQKELKSMIQDDLLSDEFVAAQQVFDVAEIKKLKQRLYSNNPGDVHAHIWALLVFQSWWKKYFIN